MTMGATGRRHRSPCQEKPRRPATTTCSSGPMSPTNLESHPGADDVVTNAGAMSHRTVRIRFGRVSSPIRRSGARLQAIAQPLRSLVSSATWMSHPPRSQDWSTRWPDRRLPLPTGFEGRLDVDDRRPVDCLEAAHLDAKVVDGPHRDLVNAEWVWPMLRPGGEDAAHRPARVAAGMHSQNGAVG